MVEHGKRMVSQCRGHQNQRHKTHRANPHARRGLRDTSTRDLPDAGSGLWLGLGPCKVRMHQGTSDDAGPGARGRARRSLPRRRCFQSPRQGSGVARSVSRASLGPPSSPLATPRRVAATSRPCVEGRVPGAAAMPRRPTVARAGYTGRPPGRRRIHRLLPPHRTTMFGGLGERSSMVRYHEDSGWNQGPPVDGAPVDRPRGRVCSCRTARVPCVSGLEGRVQMISLGRSPVRVPVESARVLADHPSPASCA